MVTTDSNGILVSTLDSHIPLFDKPTGSCLQTYTSGYVNKDYRVRSCIGRPGDAWVLTGSEDGKLVAYDLPEGREAASLRGQHKEWWLVRWDSSQGGAVSQCRS